MPLVDGAVVHGYWSGAFGQTVSASTGGDGTVTFATDWVRVKKSKIFTFTVTGVAQTGWVYDPSANTETSDSITVK